MSLLRKWVGQESESAGPWERWDPCPDPSLGLNYGHYFCQRTPYSRSLMPPCLPRLPPLPDYLVVPGPMSRCGHNTPVPSTTTANPVASPASHCISCINCRTLLASAVSNPPGDAGRAAGTITNRAHGRWVQGQGQSQGTCLHRLPSYWRLRDEILTHVKLLCWASCPLVCEITHILYFQLQAHRSEAGSHEE